jgi:hypothetical protein
VIFEVSSGSRSPTWTIINHPNIFRWRAPLRRELYSTRVLGFRDNSWQALEGRPSTQCYVRLHLVEIPVSTSPSAFGVPEGPLFPAIKLPIDTHLDARMPEIEMNI